MGNWWLTASSQHACSCITSCAEFFGKTSNHPDCRGLTQLLYSPDLAPYNFWLFAKLKSSLKRKRFQTVDEIQGQLMVTGKTLWGPKVPTLKGTEASLSSVQCFLCLVSSSVSVSIFHSMWLDAFWTDLMCHNYVTQIYGSTILAHLSFAYGSQIKNYFRKNLYMGQTE